MTEADVNYIETELNLRLPEAYRNLCLHPPFAAPQGDWVYWLYEDPDDIVNETRFPLEDGGYNKANWKPTYLTIGQSASGDMHLLDTALPDSPVYILSHEDHSIIPEWSNLENFLAYWKTEGEQIKQAARERARQREAQAQKTRRWGLFMILFVFIGIALMLLLIRSPHSTRSSRHSPQRLLASAT